MLQIYLLWAQHVAGVSFDLLENPSGAIPPVERQAWLSTLREFLTATNMSLKISELRVVNRWMCALQTK